MKLTGDDSVCLMAFYGWNSFENLKKRLNSRYSRIEKLISTINSAPNAEAVQKIIHDVWIPYKQETVFYEKQE